MMKSTAAIAALALAGALSAAGAARAEHRDRDGYAGGDGYGSPDSVYVSCSSGDYGYSFCATGQSVRSARIYNRRSDASCRFGSSWGFTNQGVWVDDGCRAQFVINAGGQTRPVAHRGGGYNSGYGGYGNSGGAYGSGHGSGHGSGSGYDGGDMYGYGYGGSQAGAHRARNACERAGNRRAYSYGDRDFRLSRVVDYNGGHGRGWRVYGPASVSSGYGYGRTRLYVDCYVRRGDVVSFNVRRR